MLGNITRIFPNFQKNPACCEKYLKDNKHNSLHLAPKCARIFVHSAKLTVSGRENGCGQDLLRIYFRTYFRAKWRLLFIYFAPKHRSVFFMINSKHLRRRGGEGWFGSIVLSPNFAQWFLTAYWYVGSISAAFSSSVYVPLSEQRTVIEPTWDVASNKRNYQYRNWLWHYFNISSCTVTHEQHRRINKWTMFIRCFSRKSWCLEASCHEKLRDGI